MNKQQMEGKWEQLKGEIRKTWGKLTDDEIAQFKGETQKFYGTLQEKYGLAREEAERRMQELEKKCGASDSGSKASAA